MMVLVVNVNVYLLFFYVCIKGQVECELKVLKLLLLVLFQLFLLFGEWEWLCLVEVFGICFLKIIDLIICWIDVYWLLVSGEWVVEVLVGMVLEGLVIGVYWVCFCDFVVYVGKFCEKYLWVLF